jgi:hypothetical protein
VAAAASLGMFAAALLLPLGDGRAEAAPPSSFGGCARAIVGTIWAPGNEPGKFFWGPWTEVTVAEAGGRGTPAATLRNGPDHAGMVLLCIGS